MKFCEQKGNTKRRNIRASGKEQQEEQQVWAYTADFPFPHGIHKSCLTIEPLVISSKILIPVDYYKSHMNIPIPREAIMKPLQKDTFKNAISKIES